jgi:hypothetical protein
VVIVQVNPAFTATEEYDGTSWTTSPASLNTARSLFRQSAGTVSLAVAMGGSTGSVQMQQKNGQVQEFSNNSYNHSFLTLYLSI